jgi:hypothetical protein
MMGATVAQLIPLDYVIASLFNFIIVTGSSAISKRTIFFLEFIIAVSLVNIR